jgi:predicted Zn-dependent protease with MMP-like domain
VALRPDFPPRSDPVVIVPEAARGRIWRIPLLPSRLRGRFPPGVADSWKYLLRTAEDEVRETCANLPADLQHHAGSVPVSYESYPSDALIDDGWDPDILGMYVGDPVGVADSEASPVPRQILLFLENIWDYADGDEAIYREEVRITFIHEFGHYLGLDEDGLEERGLL